MSAQLGALFIQYLPFVAEAVQTDVVWGEKPSLSSECQPQVPRGCCVLSAGSRGAPRGHGTDATQLREGEIKTYNQEDKWWEPEDRDQRVGSGILP